MKIPRYIFVIFAIVAIMLLIRVFMIGSYRIKSNDIGYTLKDGDCVIVNKIKTKNNPARNEITLYKSPLSRDVKKPPLFVGRCIGTPGDSIRITESGFRVNGHLLPNAPMMQPFFRIKKDIKENLLNAMETLKIPFREVREDSVSIILKMSLREEELLKRNLSEVVQIEMIGDSRAGYEFVIPRKGQFVNIDEISLIVYSETVLNEIGSRAVINNGKLFIDGMEQTQYVFKKNYYWMLSENESTGIDSRHLGLIPADHVVGNVFFCWYSKDASKRFKTIH